MIYLRNLEKKMKRKYKVNYTPKAEKDLIVFRKKYWKSYLDFLTTVAALETDPRGVGEPLKGNLKGFYALHFGRKPECRALYEIIDKDIVIIIIRIGTRENFYNIF